MLEKNYLENRYQNYKTHFLKNSNSTLNISNLSINNNKSDLNGLLTNNAHNINSLIKPKIEKIKIKKYNDLSERIQKSNLTYKSNNNSLIQVNKSSGDIANELAKRKMDNYLNSDFKKDKEEKIEIIKDFNIILNHKERKKYIKEKENIFKNFKNIQSTINHNKNYKTMKKCYSQGNINDEIINEKNNEEKNDRQLLITNRLEKTQINIKDYQFHNPLNSYNIIYQNKKIYQNILKNYKGSMISEYKKSINNLNPIMKLKINKKSLPKVKILPIIKKSVESNIKENNYVNKKYNLLFKFANKKTNLVTTANKMIEEFGLFKLLNKNNKLYLLKNILQYPVWGFPESRIQFSLAQEEDDFIIYGGYNSSRISSLWKFNPMERSWIMIKENGIKNENRYGHSAALRNGNLYIFGGVYLLRNVFAGLEIFNLRTNKWTFPKWNNKKERFLLRRNHIGCSIGDQMIIYGGINEENIYLNDCYVLNYHPLQWSVPIIKKIDVMPSLAYHSCCLVIQKEVRDDPNFSLFEFPNGTFKIDNIKEKGLYIFGGQVSKNDVLNKNLYVLRIGKKPLEWIILKTKGNPPSKRYGTSMSYYELGNLLIVHGGRNNIKTYNYVLNDTFLLDLYTLNWMKVEYYDKTKNVPSRFFHQSFVYENEFFVFGGTNGRNYLGSEILILEMNSNKKCLKELEEINYMKIINSSNNNIL